MTSARLLLAVAATAWALPACEGSPGRAVGSATSMIVLATGPVWESIGDSVLAALEPRMYTVRSERTFEVTHVSPTDPVWEQMRGFRHVVSIGAASDPWVRPILAASGSASGTSGTSATSGATGAGQIVTADDVWARDQLALAIVTPTSDAAEAALPQLDRAAAVIDSLFRVQVVQRMYTSGVDTALAASLRAERGFTMLLPNVYSATPRTGDVVLYQNNTVVGGDLVRSVLVTWRDDAIAPSAAAALAWRDTVATTWYSPTQRTLRDSARMVRGAANSGAAVRDAADSGATDAAAMDADAAGSEAAGRSVGVEVQGAWEGADTTWPMGGPFLTRMISCAEQGRTYLLDAWLYAPGPRRSKYEYMIQLETIAQTFQCA